ncbi:MAG: hypothetical protein NVS3B10_31900 [Polyangiales bacterium]
MFLPEPTVDLRARASRHDVDHLECYPIPMDVELPLGPRNLVAAYRRLLDASFGARLVDMRVFGSYARGDAGEESDLDVAVVITGLTEAERTTAIDLALDALRALGAAQRAQAPLLSPLVWSVDELADRVRSERRIALDILSEGIAV